MTIFGNNIFGTSLDVKDIVVNFLFLHGIFYGNANNKVVRGGWFVGTIMIMYLLTLLLFKIFNFDNEWWKRKRILLFPLIFFIISLLTQIICENFDDRYICLNNNFMYFSFINQLPSFCLGFSLYDFSKMRIKPASYTRTIAGVAFGMSCFLFFANIKYAFVFVPTFFSVGVVCLFKLCKDTVDKTGVNNTKQSCVVHLITRLGDISFPIYLLHPLIVYEGNILIRNILISIGLDVQELVLFFILLPITLIFTFILGEIFNWYLGRANNILGIFCK